MEEFEKQFPSLKGTINTNDWGDDLILQEVIKKHCLDKQKVKDAIIKSNGYSQDLGSLGALYRTFQETILKELGLEE